jgi:hypothetical protein
MTIANQDFEVDEGASSTIAIPLTSNGAPYAVPVGSIIDWWASPSQFDAAGAVPIKRTTTGGSPGLVVSTVSGQSTLYVAVYSTDTINRGQKKLFHQARIIRSDGVVVPLFSGTMTVNKRLVV